MKYKKLRSAGEIKECAQVQCVYKGKRRKYKCVEVLNEGTEYEEILLNKPKNIYFITSMAIDGTSWAKDVMFSNIN